MCAGCDNCFVLGTCLTCRGYGDYFPIECTSCGNKIAQSREIYIYSQEGICSGTNGCGSKFVTITTKDKGYYKYWECTGCNASFGADDMEIGCMICGDHWYDRGTDCYTCGIKYDSVKTNGYFYYCEGCKYYGAFSSIYLDKVDCPNC